MNESQQTLVIIVPEILAHLPIQIIKNIETDKIILNVCTTEQNDLSYSAMENQPIFIWQHNEYLHLECDEIMWLEADGSYCIVHLKQERSIIISFPLATAQKILPSSVFIRISRSHIVNIKYVSKLKGRCFQVGKQLLKIGGEYRKSVLEKFLFLGVRNAPKI